MDLLANGMDNTKYAEERLKQSSFILSKNLLIVSIPYKQKYTDYRHNFGLRQLVEKLKIIFGNCISTYYEDKIVFLIGSENKHIINEHISKNLLDFLNLNDLRCGVSINFQNLSDIQDFFYQSVCAARLPAQLKENKYINFFDDYIEYYFFSMTSHNFKDLPRINLSTLIHPWVKELTKFDEENNSELLKTIKIYLETNRNANDT